MQSSPLSTRAIPLSAIVLLAIAVHAPLLLMQIPLGSYDANTHIFFASHYANHWFNPWNEKWYGGFTQTTYPPLTHQWIALFSHAMGLNFAYMFVQLIGIVLLVIGVYRYASLWVSERAAGFAAIGSIFLGSLTMLVYQSGQLPTTFAAALTLNSLPYFYDWMRYARFSALVKGIVIGATAAVAHHATLLFGSGLFAFPVIWLALMERDDQREESASVAGVFSRTVIFLVILLIAVAIVLAPYFLALKANPISQTPIPHGSRDNYILNPASGINFWLIPMGALLIALPFIFLRGGGTRRLLPLFVGFFVTMLFGLGATTPAAPVLLGTLMKAITGRNAFEVLTFERFTFWATLMAMPIVGELAEEIIERFRRKGAATLWVCAVLTISIALAWMALRPITTSPFKVDEVISFLNRDVHDKFRYLTLGFGNQFSKVATYTTASSVDGDYNSARLLPELTQSGIGQLYNAKYFGASGMEALRAMLKHANQYGLKYIFVRDRYYEPLLAFAGWRQIESYDNGNVELWSKDDVPPARPIQSIAVPTPIQGVLWGILPVATSLFALLLVILWPDRRRTERVEVVEFPSREIVYREAN